MLQISWKHKMIDLKLSQLNIHRGQLYISQISRNLLNESNHFLTPQNSYQPSH